MRRLAVLLLSMLTACLLTDLQGLTSDGRSPDDAAITPESGAGDANSAGADAGGASPGETPPSCASRGDGRTNCGALQESCCTSPTVTGGTFNRNYGNYGAGAFDESDPATISTFRLDKYEVTVGRFRQFVAAWNNGAGWRAGAGAGKHMHLNDGRGLADGSNVPDAGPQTVFEPGWNLGDTSNVVPTDANLACDPMGATWTPSPGSHELLPVNCVTRWEAYAFCIWDGGFLPSEAEWEYAAAGGSQELRYPWGNAEPGTGSEYAIYGCIYGSSNDAGTCTGIENLAPVGTTTRGAGLVWGHFDLAGSVWEWTLDWYANYASPCVDCAFFSNLTSWRLGRGGDFSEGVNLLSPVNRILADQTMRRAAGGVRCARAPE